MGGYELIDTSSNGCCVRKSSYTFTEVLKKVLNLVDTAVLLICVVGIDIGLIMFTNRQIAIPLFVPALYLLFSMIVMVRDVNYAFDHIDNEEMMDDVTVNQDEDEEDEEGEEDEEDDEDDEMPPLVDEYSDLPPLINTGCTNCLNCLPTYTYNKNEKVLAQLQKVVDETNVRNMWRRGEMKID